MKKVKNYRKKPVTIAALQYSGAEDFDAVRAFVPPGVLRITGNEVYIRTLEGEHHASRGDYIIRGVAGEFYPCKPDIFTQTYEEA